MQTGSSTMRSMLDGLKKFNVPIYQRAYAWDSRQLEDFLNDILNQHPEKDYFFGSFLLHKNGNEGDFEIIDIVDGQQRLTTFIIFMNSLINEMINKSCDGVSNRTKRTYIKDEDVFKLQTSNGDNPFLQNVILDGKSYEESYIDTSGKRLLLNAKEYFEKNLKELDSDTLKQIYKTSTEAEVLLYVVKEVSSATKVFELLNDRGRKLTDLESIKSFLMYNAGMAADHPDQVISNIQEDFGDIYKKIERHHIDGKNILRYHILAFEKYPTDQIDKPKDFIKDKINKLMKEDKKEVLKVIQDFSSSLRNTFGIYAEIQELKLENRNLSELFMIGRVDSYYPVLINVYKNEKNRFDDLVSNLKKFTLRAGLANLKSSAGKSTIYTALRNKEDAVSLIDGFISNNWWDINGRALEALNSENHYQWLNKNILRYLLVSYENDLRSKKGYPQITLKEYSSTDTREKLSIEHISAIKAKKVDYSNKFTETYLHNLGNLVIDYSASNSSKGPKNTQDKISTYNLAPLMSQNEIDEVYCDWKKVNDISIFIDERKERLCNFITEKFEF